MKPGTYISRHAIDRYVERVDPCVSQAEARFALERIVRLGKARSVPRQWMRRNGVSPQLGVTFIYWAERPGICVVVRGAVVLTVLTRSRRRSRARRTCAWPAMFDGQCALRTVRDGGGIAPW